MNISNLLLIDDFIDPAMCQKMLAELCTSVGEPASIYGNATSATVDSRVRRATRIVVSATLRDFVMLKLHGAMLEIGRHFDIDLRQCEDAQFLRYIPGDFFVAHQDGNTGLIRDDSRLRWISIVIFLSEFSTVVAPDTYGGGELHMHGRYPDFDQRIPVPPARGRLVAFRAETTHEVTPITHGERYTIASWYR